MGGVRMLLQRWRADRGLLVVLVLVIALTAGLVGAVPRLLNRLAIESLGRAVQDTTVDRAGLAATSVQPFPSAGPEEALSGLDRLANELASGLDPDIHQVLQAPSTVVDTTRYDLTSLPGEPADALDRKLTVRLQPDADGEVSLVSGALPDGTPGRVELALGDTGPDGEPVLTELSVRQFVATAATADALAMEVGDRRLGLPDLTGPILRRLALTPVSRDVWELSGIVELSPLDEPVWFGDPRLHRPSRFDTNVNTTIFATGFVPADAVGELPGTTAAVPARTTVRWHLDRDELLASDLTAVQQAAVALRTATPLELEDPRWSTGLDRLLAGEATRRATAVEILGLGAVALLGIAIALLVAMAAVLTVRRRDTLALVRGRGASRRQLLLAAGIEFGAVALVGGMLAQLVLLVALPGRAHAIPAVIAALALVVLLAGSSRDVHRRLGSLLAEWRRAASTPPRHYVLDGLLVVVAVVAVASLRRRGITADGTVEPLVIAAPVLLAAATAVVAARLVPLPLRAVEVVARRGRSLAVPVGLARAARAGGGGVMVVLLVLGLGVAGLASSIHRSLVDGQARAADEQVGAAVRINAQPLASLASDWSPPSAGDEVAELRLRSSATVLGADRAQGVDVVLVDPPQLAAIGAGEELPPLAWDGTGPVPVLLSSGFPVVGSPEVGDPLTVLLDEGEPVAAVVAGVDPRVFGRAHEADGAFLVMDQAAALATGIESGVTSRLVQTDDAAAVERHALAADPDAEVLVRARVREELRTAPLARGVRVGYLIAAVAAVAATAVALVMALVAGAPRRRRQAAVLSALGTSTGRIRLSLLAEVLPVVAGAATIGIALAGVVSLLLDGRLDLSPFTGTANGTSLVLPHWSVAALLVAGAMLVAGVGAVMSQGRVDPGALLREGDA